MVPSIMPIFKIGVIKSKEEFEYSEGVDLIVREAKRGFF